MRLIKTPPLIWVVLVFLAFFYAVPNLQLQNFTHLPGDFGDSRLNNYFLENIHQFFLGQSTSLIHLSFFYPFPYILGFSDNLFGTYPIYFIIRLLGFEPENAFGIWYATSYLLNFVSCFYILRKFQFSTLASVIGAVVFTFGMPISAQTSHVQLAYRFCIPFAVFSAIRLMQTYSLHNLCVMFGWVTWQFYCSIYIGFFLVILLIVLCITQTIHSCLSNSTKITFKERLHLFRISFEHHHKPIFILGLIFFLVMLLLLFYPYLMASHVYGFKRSAAEIALMLPRPGSYFLMEESNHWSFLGQYISNIPMRHEHQLWVGLTTLVLVIIGTSIITIQFNKPNHISIAISLLLIIVLTIYINQFSLWLMIADWPLVSAIRAVTRIILVLLFPMAYLCAVAIDHLPLRRLIALILILAMLFEFSSVQINSTSIADWKARDQATISKIPKNLPTDSILFFAQEANESIPNQELDAMWASLKMGMPTLNGYSGNLPPGIRESFKKDCNEAQTRIQNGVKFLNNERNLAKVENYYVRIVLIGFDNCALGVKN